jgi:hypothetical protein
LGDDIRSFWGGDSRASVVLGDKEVCRFKNKKENGYYIAGVKDQELMEFKAIRSDIPEEVSRVLNMNNINLQTQLESHFLISSSAGDVSKHFNKIAHLDKIDTATQYLTTALRRFTQVNSFNNSEIKRLSEELETFDDIEDIENRLADLSTKERLIQDNKKAIKNIETLDLELSKVKKKIKKKSQFIKAEERVSKLLEVSNNLEGAENDIDNLSYDIEKLEGLDEDIGRKLLWLDIEESVSGLFNAWEESKVKYALAEEIHEAVLSFNKVDEKLSIAKKKLSLSEIEFHEEMGGEICPLCGSNIDPNET